MGFVPEGDSVYVLARRLDVLNGRRLRRGELRVPQHATADLAGRTVSEQVTYGKHLLTRLSGDLTLHTHLRMDGSWTVVRAGRTLPRNLLPDVRVLLATEDGPTAYGLDLPVVDLIATADEQTTIGHLGPDPLRGDWDPAEAARRLAVVPGRPVSAALLDQRNLAGLGNLWVNELCFLRGLDPWTPVAEVDLPALVRLAARALRHSALTPGAFQVTTGDNRRGRDHWVSGRFAQPCRRCGTTIEMVAEVPNDPDRRRTWWCPRCQPGPGPGADRARR